MVQILPPLNYIGESKSSGAGDFFKGLGSGIQGLVEKKTKEIQKQNELKALNRIGFTPEQSDILSQIKEINPQQYSEYLGRALENLGNRQPEEYIQEQIQTPAGKEVSIQKEISSPSIKNNLLAKGLSEKEKAERFKQTKEYRQSILDARKNAKSDLRDLSRLEELNKSGGLDSAGYVEFLHNSGLDIPALMSEDSQEFAKIQQSFLKNAKQYFGGRVSNYEVEQFLKTIPSLSQTPAGRARVIANLKLLARGSEEYYKAYEDVIRKNGGVPPYDIQEEVERRLDKDKRLDKIYNQFKEELKQPVPKGQNRFITALMAKSPGAIKSAGDLVSNVVTGAAKGVGAIGGAALLGALL